MRPKVVRYWGSRARGGNGKREFYNMFVFPLLARESAEERGNMRGREWTCVAVDKMGGRLRCFYILLSLPIVS